MIPRWARIALVAGVAFFYTLIVFNNLTDPDSNYQFVRHVLRMDSTFPGNRGMWRAINAPWMHVAFFAGIIAWEIVTTVLLGWGALRMARARRARAGEFRAASRLAQTGLAVSLLMWLVAFLAVGGEWFLMWQSPTWNGQQAAARNFTVVALVMLMVAQRETEAEG
jgi:predicted small integral membrane protein